jgi:hypothetical protein
MFSLYESSDCGLNYGVVKKADTLLDLRKECNKLDKKGLRWYIEDEYGSLIEISGIHKKIMRAIARSRS